MTNMPDKEFKAMVMKMCTGLDRRVEDFSETLNKTENKQKNRNKRTEEQKQKRTRDDKNK